MENQFIGHNPLNVLEQKLPVYHLLFEYPKNARTITDYHYYGIIIRVVPASYYNRNLNFEMAINLKSRDKHYNVNAQKMLLETPQKCDRKNDLFRFPTDIFHKYDQLYGDAYLIKYHGRKYLKINDMHKIIDLV